MKKKGILLFLIFFLFLNNVSAYIDPGTGGYLATSLFSTVVTYLAIIFASIGAFFSVYFIKPIKNFIKSHKKFFIFILILIIIIIIVILFLFQKPKNKFESSLSGSHSYNLAKIYPGYNLYEGKLIDMKGSLIHNWSSIYLGVIDKNGDYYSQEYYESLKWGRYSWNNSIIWEMNLPIHHEILLTPQDTIITFTKETHEYNGRSVEFDVILQLYKNGSIFDRWSTWDNLEYLKGFHKSLELEQAPSILIPQEHRKNASIWGGNYDYYHLNSLSLVPNNSLEKIHPAFTHGNWIISFRHGSMIFILDKNTKQVLWRAIDDQIQGNLEGPHTPFMTSQGNVIVLDNGRYRKWSRIISINPINLNITWEYKTNNPKDFFSLSQSSVELLKNNNILVTESEKGRVFELTPEKEIVWEFYHPEKQNKTNSADPTKYRLRQEIYRMTRYDKGFIENIINKNSN